MIANRPASELNDCSWLPRGGMWILHNMDLETESNSYWVIKSRKKDPIQYMKVW